MFISSSIQEVKILKLSEYDDEDLIEELKHRGVKIEIIGFIIPPSVITGIKISGIKFDVKI